MSTSLPERPRAGGRLRGRLGRRPSSGRLAPFSAPIRASPAAACSPPPCWETLKRYTERLAVDPAAAVAVDDERGWPPLLYACYSQWHHIDASRAAGLADVVRLLLDAGASPRHDDGGRQRYRSALKGSVEVEQPRHHRGAPRRRRQPGRRRVHRRSGRARAPSLSRVAPLLRCPGGRHLGAWSCRMGPTILFAMTLLLQRPLSRDGADVAQLATEALPDAAADASVAVV